MPNFKCLSNSIPELLNVFEDPAQRVHTITFSIFACHGLSKSGQCGGCSLAIPSALPVINSLTFRSCKLKVRISNSCNTERDFAWYVFPTALKLRACVSSKTESPCNVGLHSQKYSVAPIMNHNSGLIIGIAMGDFLPKL